MNRNSLGKWGEMLCPWITASIAAVGALLVNQRLSLPADVESRLLDKVVDVCAISIGFWATALALLLALDERKTVEGLRKLGIYNRIVGYFLTTLYVYFFLLLLSLGTIAIGRPAWFPRRPYVALWAFALTLSVTTMLRSFTLLGKLLRAR